MSGYRIGIDVGGTNTDAVVMDEHFRVIAKTKAFTTENVSEGIYTAMRDVILKAEVSPQQIELAMLGTTHCTNAIVERKKLSRVGIIRIGAPAALSVKPLAGVPNDIAELFNKYVYLINGGNEFDGREIVPLDEEAIYEAAVQMKGQVDSVAITSIFSPITNVHETRAAAILHEVMGSDLPISLSSEIGSVGLLERENATILNAAVVDVARSTAEGFITALREEGIDARVFFTQNDGTLMSIEYAIRYPILTIACGPTNSLRGASFLTGLTDTLVVDVGGTTTDIGVLVQSYPRESSLAVAIGGVRTNFRMPDLISIGLGGGTTIHLGENGSFSIGPDSVGYRLPEKALIFGGDTLTTTDVVVALGKADLGNRNYVKHLDRNLLEAIYSEMITSVENAIDQMKTSADSVSVIMIGGGSILLPEELKGVSQVIRPDHLEVANAIGAANAHVSGQVEKIYSLDALGRDKALEDAKQSAINEAIKAGADPTTCQVVDLEDIPLAYLPGNATRIRVKVSGNLL